MNSAACDGASKKRMGLEPFALAARSSATEAQSGAPRINAATTRRREWDFRGFSLFDRRLPSPVTGAPDAFELDGARPFATESPANVADVLEATAQLLYARWRRAVDLL